MSSNQGSGCLSIFHKKGGKNTGDFSNKVQNYEHDGENVENFPYVANDRFLSPDEFSFYRLAVQVLQERYTVCPKVALAELLKVEGDNAAAWYRICQKRIDFVVCDSQTMKPIYAIELDDSSHNQKKRQERDRFLDEAFKAAHLPLIHVIDQHAYSREDLIEQLVLPLNRVNQRETAAPVAPPPLPVKDEQTQEAPLCPNCGKRMIVRTSSKTGRKFWVCINYPLCKGMIPVSDR